MATVINLPKDTRFSAFGEALGFGLAGHLERRRREREEQEKVAQIEKAGELFRAAMEGGGTLERTPRTQPGPHLSGAPRRPVTPGEIFTTLTKADPRLASIGLSLEDTIMQERARRREEDEAERAQAETVASLQNLADKFPEGPYKDLANALLEPGTPSGLRTAGLTQLLAVETREEKGDKDALKSITFFHPDGRKMTLDVPESVRKGGRSAIREWASNNVPKGFSLVEPAPAEKTGKPLESELDVEAILKANKLEPTPENLARARLFRRNETETMDQIDSQLKKQTKAGFFEFSTPLDALTASIAKDQAETLFLSGKVSSAGEASKRAIDEAQERIKSGEFIPDAVKKGGLIQVARYIKNIMRGDVTEEQMATLLKGFGVSEETLRQLQSVPEYQAMFALEGGGDIFSILGNQ